jgi:hypothetical protein
LLPADQTLVQGPGLTSSAATVVDVARTKPELGALQTNSSQVPVASPQEKDVLHRKRLRRIRRFGIAGGLVVFILSISIGFLLRWLGWMGLAMAYDEFALTLLGIGLRDAIFGVFLGITLSVLGRKRAQEPTGRGLAASLIHHAACGAAIGMLPFVVLRTSLFLIPLGLAITGAVVGLLICGVRILSQRFSAK